MREEQIVTGMVLSAIPIGEYDKRVVILTRELGKIHAFARGARKQNNALMAASQPFTFGTFTVHEGKSAYTLSSAKVENYFLKLREDLDSLYYGFYFLEVADYFGRENVDGTETLKLLYQSFRALMKRSDQLDLKLIRYIFEWKMLALEGMMPQTEECEALFGKPVSPAVGYAMRVIGSSPIERLYTFTLSEEAKQELGMLAARCYRRFVDRTFRSLAMIE